MTTITHDGNYANAANGNWALARLFSRFNPWTPRQYSLLGQPGSVTYTTLLRDGSGVDVYLVDSGIDATHDEFTGVSITELDNGIGSIPNTPHTTYHHGSWLASQIAGSTVGVAPGVNLFSVRDIAEGSQSVTAANFEDCLEAIITHAAGRSNPFVVSVSIEGFTDTASIETDINTIVADGGVFIVAVGNTIEDIDTDANAFPQRYTNTFTVAGSEISDHQYHHPAQAGSLNNNALISGSDFGSTVDVFAPGVHLKVPDIATGSSAYGILTGTSLSAPLAAGVAALMLQGRSKMTSEAEVLAFYAEMRANAIPNRVKLLNAAEDDTTTSLLYFDPSTPV